MIKAVSNPANLMREFHNSSKTSFIKGNIPAFDDFLRESALERLLIHLLELDPVSVQATLDLATQFERFAKQPHRKSTQDALLQAVDVALEQSMPPDIEYIRGYPFSLAKPGYCFVSSRRLRTFFPNINEMLCDHDKSNIVVREYLEAIRCVHSQTRIDRLCFIDKAFGPPGALELGPAIYNAIQVPSMIYRSYSWRRAHQPVCAGQIKTGESLCVLYDAGITGGLILDFADYAASQGAQTTAAVVFFDFDEGAAEALADRGIHYAPILRKHTILADIARCYERTYNAEFIEYPAVYKQSRSALELRFKRLSKVWKRETVLYSNAKDITRHRAFKQIVGLGKQIIPLVLREYEHDPGHWDMVLTALADTDPVPNSCAGDVYQIRHHWLAWGRKQKLLPYGPYES